MHGRDHRGAQSYLTYLQQVTLDQTLLGTDFTAVERKSLSLYQYCRYPANSLNRLNLRAPGSRHFRFCRHALPLISM
jgi:hypothetical protein